MARARSTYHAATLARIGKTPPDPRRAKKTLADREKSLGFVIPPSVRDWYESQAAITDLRHFWSSDWAVPAEELGDPNDLRHGLLKFLVESQGVADWYVALDGSDDPTIEVVSEMFWAEADIADDFDPLDSPDWRRREANPFSEFVHRRALVSLGSLDVSSLVRDLEAVQSVVILDGRGQIREVWFRKPGVGADLLARLGAVETLTSIRIEPGGIASHADWPALAVLARVEDVVILGR